MQTSILFRGFRQSLALAYLMVFATPEKRTCNYLLQFSVSVYLIRSAHYMGHARSSWLKERIMTLLCM